MPSDFKVLPSETLVKLEATCAELRKREISNRPFNTEELVGTLLVMAESIKELMTSPTSGIPDVRLPIVGAVTGE